VLGNVSSLAVWGSRFAPLSNWIAGSAPVRRLNQRMLGVDQRRRLPQFKRHTLRHLARGDQGPADALLFTDTFTNHYDPEIGLAVIRVLQRAGIRTALAPNHCCARPQISKGLLARARQMAERNTNALHADAAAGRPIVFCEPSCLSAVREDAPALLRGETRRRAEQVAAASVLFEEYAATLLGRLTLKPGPTSVLLHGHCHQKSMGLVGAAKTTLSHIPGVSVVDLDAGCCGMAGSFGYAHDHYDVSRAIGERKLFPAVRKKAEGSVVVAAGTSCRHQIADFTGEKAIHPALLLESLLP
jgi:Fe-S oxidoreductase